MHLVTAVIKPHKLAEVKEALQDAGITGLTLTEVRGFGRQRGHTEVYRGTEYEIDFVPKLKLEVLVTTERRDAVVKAISSTASTGTIGDGKVWVVPVDLAMRIRTSELGEDAI